jgi:hypothetical protein
LDLLVVFWIPSATAPPERDLCKMIEERGREGRR